MTTESEDGRFFLNSPQEKYPANLAGNAALMVSLVQTKQPHHPTPFPVPTHVHKNTVIIFPLDESIDLNNQCCSALRSLCLKLKRWFKATSNNHKGCKFLPHVCNLSNYSLLISMDTATAQLTQCKMVTITCCCLFQMPSAHWKL